MEHNIFESYRYVEAVLIVEQRKLEVLKHQLSRWIELGGPGQVKSISYDNGRGGSKTMPIEKYYDELNRLNELVKSQETYVQTLVLNKKEMDKELEAMIDNLSSLEEKIFFMRTVKHLQIKEISQLIGYSNRQIIRICRKFKTKVNQTVLEIEKKKKL